MYQFRSATDRIWEMRNKIRDRVIQIDAERSVILTEAWKRIGDMPPLIRVAEGLYETCAKVTCPVEDFELIVGSIGKNFCGAGLNSDWRGEGWALGVVESGKWQLGEDGLYHSEPEAEIAMCIAPEDVEAFKEIREFWKGKTVGAPASAWQPDFFQELCDLAATSYVSAKGIMGTPCGHIAPGHKKIVDVGYKAIKEQALKWLDEHRYSIMGDDVERYVFYKSAARTCDAGTILCRRYGEACRAKAENCSDPKRKAELEMMADGLEWISENPARTFWEACQATMMFQLLIMLESSPPALAFGRFDQYTWPYLKKDLEAGRITMDEAQEIVDAFFLKSECFYKGGTGTGSTAAGIGNTYQHTTVGGVDPATGEDSSNPVTFMVLETLGRLYLHDPTISLRINKNTPPELWECAIATAKRVGGLPLFQNDEVIIPTAMKELGFDLYDARNYCFIGCQEIVGSGTDYPAPSGIHPPHNGIHYGVILTTALNNGVNPMNGAQASLKTGYLYEMNSFEEVKEAFAKMAKYIFHMYVSINNYCEYLDVMRAPHPSMSISIEGCMESGRDCTVGGAKYNSYGGTATGLATVADSLTTIKYMCFDKKLCTTRELYDAYMANWEGYEDLQKKVLSEVPHFGNNDPYADEQLAWCMNLYHEMCGEVYSVRSKVYRAGLYGATDHIMQGYHTWATPDGRKAGAPIADAASPCQGRDKFGPTGVFSSQLCFDHTMFADGMALNIRIHPSALQTDEDCGKLANLTKTYFDNGGMEVQYNVVSAETMRKAQENPAEYRDLVVRIAGYSAYFVELTTDCQNDLISRTENNL